MAWTERYCRADAPGGGDGTTNTNAGAHAAWTLAEAITNAASGMKINVVQAGGTFSNTTTNRVFGTAGTATAPIWWAGCNAAEDDIYTTPSLAKPSITFTTGQFQISAGFQLFTNLSISGAQTVAGGGVLHMTAAAGTQGVNFDRVRVENTAANSNSRAVYTDNSMPISWSRCWFKATSTAAAVIDLTAGTGSPRHAFLGCATEGGGDHIQFAGGANTSMLLCYKHAFRAPGGKCVNDSGSGCLYALGCTLEGAAGDGITASVSKTSSATGVSAIVADCIFTNNGGWGINESAAGGYGAWHRVNNLFGNPANVSGTETGFGDMPDLSAVTSDGVTTLTSSSDLTPASGSAARAAGLPGGFENEAFTTYDDVGAVRHQDPAGGGAPNQIVGARSIGTY